MVTLRIKMPKNQKSFLFPFSINMLKTFVVLQLTFFFLHCLILLFCSLENCCLRFFCNRIISSQQLLVCCLVETFVVVVVVVLVVVVVVVVGVVVVVVVDVVSVEVNVNSIVVYSVVVGSSSSSKIDFNLKENRQKYGKL